ncbi:histidine kinase N-terminal domain-containing protein [Sebaldella sp. S0638]|uniref:histidine kinase N-terminal domain-containing protein n=1 Tax=Sebaldella sp. S0638 TaxID=2957809 RepID=UPI00209E1BC9|nr:sensor histidine kinase [Sebaldella sp. S0638]
MLFILRELCKKYTDLDDNDIAELEDYAKKLKIFAEFTDTDLFIDCIIPNSNYAVVVYQQRPVDSPTLFKNSVLGVIVGIDTEPAVIRTLKTGITSKKLKAFTQDKKSVYETVVPIPNSHGKIIGALVSEHDVTKQVNQDKQIKLLEQTQKKLRDNLEYLKNNPEILTEHINQSVIIFDHNGQTVYANPEAKALYKKLGYIEDIQKIHMENLILDENHYCQLNENRSGFENEISIGDLTLKIRYVCLSLEGNNCTMMIITDISEMRNKEKELILKSVAVKEIHHRVKNNLQTIASILSMQARRINDSDMKRILNENISYIDSIAATHEILAEQGFEHIDIKELIKKLSLAILNYSSSDSKTVKIAVNGDTVLVNADTASSVMLVINELLSNSLEHGFRNKKSGIINIKISNEGVFAIFTITDNGDGFQQKTNFESLGLNIVKAIVKDKLNGKFRIQAEKEGTSTEFSIKIK